MDAGDLRVFAAVARLGGMNRAAGALNTVQSNVTARIRALEAELDLPLFERHSRGVALTAAGRRLLPYAERVALLLDEARRAVRDDGTPAGPLLLGSLETTAALRLSPVLADFAAAHPAVDLALTTGTSAELVDLVLAHRLEGAFVCGPLQHPDLVAEPAFREELVLVTARGERRLEAVLARPELRLVVLRAGCSYRQRLEEILARRGVVGLRRLEFGTVEAFSAAPRQGSASPCCRAPWSSRRAATAASRCTRCRARRRWSRLCSSAGATLTARARLPRSSPVSGPPPPPMRRSSGSGW